MSQSPCVFFNCRLWGHPRTHLSPLASTLRSTISPHLLSEGIVCRALIVSSTTQLQRMQYFISPNGSLYNTSWFRLDSWFGFALIALYVLGRRTGIYTRDEDGTGTVPDQHTVPPYSWMRTNFLLFALDLTWLGSWFNFSSTSPFALIMVSSFHMLVKNIISLGAWTLPSINCPLLFDRGEEREGWGNGICLGWLMWFICGVK